MFISKVRLPFMHLLSFFVNCTGAAIPRKGDEAKTFEAKWTLTKEGQRKYGGWAGDGIHRYDALLLEIKQIREADEANGKEFQKYCLKIMRELNKIPENQLTYLGPAKRKKEITVSPDVVDPSKRKKRRFIE